MRNEGQEVAGGIQRVWQGSDQCHVTWTAEEGGKAKDSSECGETDHFSRLVEKRFYRGALEFD
eukprot:763142-Hanusia_phi.AAC.3